MKLPSLPKPRSKANPKATKAQVRMPRALEDLYRDMRDRRLIIPALALIVAMVAVPVALKAPTEDPPAALAFTAPEGSEAVAPAVLTEQPIGVRDYRQRLDELKSKNPFTDRFAFPEDAAGVGGSGDAGSEPVDLGAVPAGGTSDPGSGLPNNDTGAPTGPGTPATDIANDTGAGGTDTGGGGGGGSDDEVLILAPMIDVSAGPVGNRKNISDVEIGDLLPDRRKAPVVIFLGATTNLKSANFLVSGDVTETAGDGDCQPRDNDCEFLRLRKGEKRSFVYEPTGRRYVVKVKDIREEVVDRRKVQTD
jgi:hypothetical protein